MAVSNKKRSSRLSVSPAQKANACGSKTGKCESGLELVPHGQMKLSINTARERPNMSRFDRRLKIVSFRLSEKEYKVLRDLCSAHGIPSISDLARRAIQERFVDDRAADESVADAIRELRGKVQELDAECRAVAQRLHKPALTGQSSGDRL